MKGNNEDSFFYSGPISSARWTKIYVNYAHLTHILYVIKYNKSLSKTLVNTRLAHSYNFWTKVLVCLLDLILYVSVNTFSVMSGWFFMGWTSSKQVLMCLVQRHNAVTPMRVDQEAPWSWVKHCTSKPLCSLHENAFGCSFSSVDSKRLAVSNWQNINNYVHVAWRCLQSAWIVTVW